jgi:hypothetical protein
MRSLILIALGVLLTGVGYLIRRKYPPRKRNPLELGDAVAVLILLGGAVDSLSPGASLLSQACLVGLVVWVGSWLTSAWRGGD